MARVCETCGKHPASGNMVSHSKRRTRRRWLPNLQKINVVTENGSMRSIRICTRCLRTFKNTENN